MRVIKAGRLAFRIVLATLWACALCIGGLWLALGSAPRAGGAQVAVLMLAIALFAMGQFVFFAGVADRLVPRASPHWTWPVHIAAGTTALVGLLATCAVVFGR